MSFTFWFLNRTWYNPSNNVLHVIMPWTFFFFFFNALNFFMYLSVLLDIPLGLILLTTVRVSSTMLVMRHEVSLFPSSLHPFWPSWNILSYLRLAPSFPGQWWATCSSRIATAQNMWCGAILLEPRPSIYEPFTPLSMYVLEASLISL